MSRHEAVGIAVTDDNIVFLITKAAIGRKLQLFSPKALTHAEHLFILSLWTLVAVGLIQYGID